VSIPGFSFAMADLRWILLVAGVLFLLVLAGWELQRARRARRAAELEARSAIDAALIGSPRESEEPALASEPTLATEPALQNEPTLAHEPPVPARERASERRIEPTFSEPTLDESELVEPVMPLTASSAIEASPPLRVEWPAERERHIFALRIVAPASERLSGRVVRQALGACGFIHGPYRIYHQPGSDGRTLLSCANLTRPGDFDPLTLDFQRLTGLSLFAIVPGPLPPLAALAHLLETANDLARRVRAELADERGAPLDEARVMQLTAMAHEWTMPTSGTARTPGVGSSSTSGA
jgi:cell division protein ZipA